VTVSTKAPAGAPNVITILLDDLGFGQFGCYGSDIATPNIDRLAAGGLRYSRFHVTALCSPTRAALLTGRNHHSVGMGFLCDIPTTDPGYTARIPESAATLPRILRDSGWNTMAVGKWHLTPTGERSSAGPFDRWPLGLGFEKYYGFLRGDANHWAPELVRDNSYVDPPRGPHEGYHLTEDLADEAIRMVVNQQESASGKPFYLYFATGAMHAPHHVEKSWADDYAGQFDIGWDAWRNNVFERQLASGVIPPGTTLTERPTWVPDWNALTSTEKQVYARMHEVYAGFLSHTDAQIGRLLDSLEQMGIMDNTLILVMSDNGASAEGGVGGTSNEHRFTHQIRDDIEDTVTKLEDWGGLKNYPHYAWGWAWAGNTPFRLWKRYTWLGGTRVPLIAHWPKGISGNGQVRGQFSHAIDILPTVLDACGISVPESVDGVSQMPIAGASLLSTFTDACAPDPRSIQYFEMLGSRSIVADGWKATTNHVSTGVADEELMMEGSRDFATDKWSLFRLSDDFSEAHDLAGEYPEIVDKLEQQWFVEAGRFNVTPLADGLRARASSFRRRDYPVESTLTLYPNGGPVSDDALPRLAGGGSIIADIDVVVGKAEGVLFALGDWSGGYVAYVADGLLTIVVATPGGPVRVVADRPLTTGRHQVGCAFRLLPPGRLRVEAMIDETVAGSVETDHELPHAWQHGGSSITLGHDRGLPVCEDYQPPFAWNGTLHRVIFETPDLVAPRPDEVMRIALQVD
jgi:arylsulfatase A-like enzyme